MALGDPYATSTALKNRLRGGGTFNDTDDDTALTNALATASRGIDLYCHRQFNKATTATARKFHVAYSDQVSVADFHTDTDSDLAIATDDDGDGTFERTWTAADYELRPVDGIVDGLTGWPYDKIVAVGSLWFPCGRRTTLQVTAQWGWDAVPETITEACLIVAEDVFKLKDAPFGVAGVNDFGLMRVRDNPLVVAKLAPYRRYAALVA